MLLVSASLIGCNVSGLFVAELSSPRGSTGRTEMDSKETKRDKWRNLKKESKKKKQEQREKGRMEEMTERKWSLRRVLQTQEPLVTSRWDVTAPTTSPFVGPNHCNYLFFPFSSRRVFVLAPKSDLQRSYLCKCSCYSDVPADRASVWSLRLYNSP